MGFRKYVPFLLSLLYFSNCTGSYWPPKTKILHIGGIFPINGTEGWQGGQACQPAARLALEDVNSRADLIPGYKLKLHWNDSECEPGLGALVMYDLLYKPPQKLMLLAGCSTVSTTVAEAARMWNLIVLSYGASSPALSNRQRFPTLFRTHPSATVHNPTRVKLMQHFGWSRIAILQQAEEVFTSTVEDLESRCRDASIEIITRQSFLNDPTEAVRNLRRQDARIIVGLFYVVAARRVLCEMYKHGLYGRLYVWFFIGWYEDNWYEVNLAQEKIECTREQMKQAAEGHITTEALNWNQDNSTTISGMTVEDFRLRLNAALKQQGYDIDNDRYPEGYQEAPLAYDAIWAAAMALNKTMERLNRGKTIKIEDFTYSNKEIAAELYSAMNSTQFLGVSGTVAFSSKGDRIAWTQFEQMLGGKYFKLGYYDTQTDNLTWLTREKWTGGKVPQDRTIIREVLRTVSRGLFTTMCIVSAIGILIAIGLFVFNTLNRDRRLIQMSQPSCNNLMLLGIILLLSSVFVLGLDGETVLVGHFEFVCQARAWLLCCGFTLAFGAMFSKVWHVHRLSTKAKQEGKTGKHGKVDWLVCGLLLVDVVVLGVWAIVDPLYRSVEQFALEDPFDSNEDMKNKPILEHCISQFQNIWLGVVYGYKGLLLMFGLFLAYETRSMKVKSINDTRFVGMSIYNVVVLCLITAPVTLVISSQQDASFAFVTLALVFCCFLSMALVFVPKIMEVLRHPSDKTEVKPSERLASREEEEKLRKLMAENEQLQKLIAAKEEKVRLLTAKVQEKSVIAPKKVSVTKNNEVRFQLSPHDSPKERRGEIVEKEALSTTTNTSATLVIGEDIYMENIPHVEKPEGKYALEESYL